MAKEYKTNYDCEQMEYEDGAKRSAITGKGRFDLIPTSVLFRLAQVYERGANKHGERNWEKGFPICRAIDSAIRHILQFKLKMVDEDHAAQAIWNIFAAAHFEEMVEKGVLPSKWDDRPVYEPEKDYLNEPKDVEIENKPLKRISVNKGALYDTGRRFKSSLKWKTECGPKRDLTEEDFNFGDEGVIEDLEPKCLRREPEISERSEEDRK
jgi:hypothetical protein